MFNLSNIFSPTAAKNGRISKEDAAKLLATSPEALEVFERAYAKHVLEPDEVSDNFFGLNSRQASAIKRSQDTELAANKAVPYLQKLKERIVAEMVAQTRVYVYDGKNAIIKNFPVLPDGTSLVTNKDIKPIPKALRPNLTGDLMQTDISEPSYPTVLFWYQRMMDERLSPKKRKEAYNQFRQGLDILDLDAVLYDIISRNVNSMGHWLPTLVSACESQNFFRIPATTVAQVPLTMLQLTRLPYTDLSPTTLAIVDEWAMKVFALNSTKDYFIKTGTYSSKFDFRNCHVHGESEVKTLGEYLLFVHFQALQLASPLSHPTIYGASTTTEWVVREFIADKENNPRIYKGLPLHTEYRAFIDCEEGTVLGVYPYWDADTMLRRFGQGKDADSPHQMHDYVVYKAYQETLEKRFSDNEGSVKSHLQNIVPKLNLKGQWSIDIMQNGNDFWIIDMALAQDSAFYDKVPAELRKHTDQKWLTKA